MKTQEGNGWDLVLKPFAAAIIRTDCSRGAPELALSHDLALLMEVLSHMTRTKVTRIIHVVFFLWLVTSIALGLTTLVTLLPLPDERHGYEEAGNSRVPLANGDQQTQSFPCAGHLANPFSTITIQRLPGASSGREHMVPHAFCRDQACSVTNRLPDLIATLKRITKGDCPWLLRLTSTVLTVQCALLAPALNFTDLQRPLFGMRLAFPLAERNTP